MPGDRGGRRVRPGQRRVRDQPHRRPGDRGRSSPKRSRARSCCSRSRSPSRWRCGAPSHRPARRRLVMAGRMPGAIIGAAVVVLVAPDVLTAVIGVAILVAVALSVARLHVRVRPATAAAGLTAGVMGPRPASTGHRSRCSTSTTRARRSAPPWPCALCSAPSMSAATLASPASTRGEQLVFTLELLPALGVGLLASTWGGPAASRRGATCGRWCSTFAAESRHVGPPTRPGLTRSGSANRTGERSRSVEPGSAGPSCVRHLGSPVGRGPRDRAPRSC